MRTLQELREEDLPRTPFSNRGMCQCIVGCQPQVATAFSAVVTFLFTISDFKGGSFKLDMNGRAIRAGEDLYMPGAQCPQTICFERNDHLVQQAFPASLSVQLFYLLRVRLPSRASPYITGRSKGLPEVSRLWTYSAGSPHQYPKRREGFGSEPSFLSGCHPGTSSFARICYHCAPSSGKRPSYLFTGKQSHCPARALALGHRRHPR